MKKWNITGKRSTSCKYKIRFLTKDEESPSANTQEYQSKIGALNFISRYTRPDISYVTSFLAPDPKEIHMDALNHVMMYLNHTADKTLRIHPSRTGTAETWEINTYSDADYADHSDSSESTTGMAIFLNDSLIAWESKKQKSTTLSTT